MIHSSQRKTAPTKAKRIRIRMKKAGRLARAFQTR
jgi:hypothetical protein